MFSKRGSLNSKEEAIKTNAEWAKRLILMYTAITAVKPSGTVSQLVDSASGIHPRYADQYIRKSGRTQETSVKS